MQFTTFIAIFATASLVAASPLAQFDSGIVDTDMANLKNSGNNNGQSNANKGMLKGKYSVNQAIQSCGNGQVSCCNSVEQADKNAGGVVGIILEGVGPLGVGCSPLTVGAAAVDKVCSKETVCCTGPSMETQFGAVNIGCTPIDISVL